VLSGGLLERAFVGLMRETTWQQAPDGAFVIG
jgi:hypothetical protein